MHCCTLEDESTFIEIDSGKIIWLGQLRRVEVLAAVTTGTRQHRPPDDPIALVGTKLLSPHLLLMDLAKRSIEIEAQD